ncbi:hypothetical protein GCM10020000_41580 [Streptomyces olivoverticillatus]
MLAEKPLTCDPARTAELLDLARERGLVLVENVLFVHHSQHTVVRNLVRDGAIGELRAFHAAFTVPKRRPRATSGSAGSLAGGALWDVGIYPVRAAVHFLGDALEVVGAHLTTGAGREVDTAGAALLRAPGGVTAQLTFGMEHAYRNAYELHGSEGRITVERVFTPPADHHPLVRVETASGAEELRLDPDDQAVNALTAFAGAVRAGSAPGRDVRAEAVLLGAIRASAGGGHR